MRDDEKNKRDSNRAFTPLLYNAGNPSFGVIFETSRPGSTKLATASNAAVQDRQLDHAASQCEALQTERSPARLLRCPALGYTIECATPPRDSRYRAPSPWIQSPRPRGRRIKVFRHGKPYFSAARVMRLTCASRSS